LLVGEEDLPHIGRLAASLRLALRARSGPALEADQPSAGARPLRAFRLPPRSPSPPSSAP